MYAADVMTREVTTVPPDALISDAIGLMLDRRVSGLPVVDTNGTVVGILSEGDLLRRVELNTQKRRPTWLVFLRGPEREASDYVRTHTLRVADVMTPNPVTVDEDASLDAVVELMTSKRVRRLPVTSGGKLTGIVSRADLMRALRSMLPARAIERRPDEDIRIGVLEAIASEPWSQACVTEVSVDDGDVRVGGTVFQDGLTDALKVAAERVPGVRRVDVDMRYTSPYSIGV